MQMTIFLKKYHFGVLMHYRKKCHFGVLMHYRKECRLKIQYICFNQCKFSLPTHSALLGSILVVVVGRSSQPGNTNSCTNKTGILQSQTNDLCALAGRGSPECKAKHLPPEKLQQDTPEITPGSFCMQSIGCHWLLLYYKFNPS